MFCESRAQSISKTESGWEIVVQDLSKAGASRRIEAPIVVLAAGTLGTNELLLRAQQRGLELSAKLGENFSANGDDLVFADKLAEPVNAIATGFPPQAPRGTAPVGPHSMALIDLGDEHGPLWVHDGTMLALMAALAPLENLLKLKVGNALRLLKEGIYGDEHEPVANPLHRRARRCEWPPAAAKRPCRRRLAGLQRRAGARESGAEGQGDDRKHGWRVRRQPLRHDRVRRQPDHCPSARRMRDG